MAIEERVKQIVIEQLGVKSEEVTPQTGQKQEPFGSKSKSIVAYSLIFFNRRAFPMTEIELKVIVALAMTGLKRIPNSG